MFAIDLLHIYYIHKFDFSSSEEWRNFVAGGILLWECILPCFCAMCAVEVANVMAYQLQIPESVFTQLNERHWQLLTCNFGLHFSFILVCSSAHFFLICCFLYTSLSSS